ncbi:MAG TPA: M28 family peptidase [Thermomicrobiales bacterium]|nr:M28 family peptidase [Thermomicrobiales bacterium]
MTTALTDHEQALLEDVSADSLMNSTRAIAQWVRLSGTADEAKAFDWVEQTLQGYGLETTRYQHPGLVSWPESASLVITDAGGMQQTIRCSTHAFATSTPGGGLEGELVAVGSGSAAELGDVDLEGRIALADGIVAPNRHLAIDDSAAVASIWIAGTYLHERALSPVWGTPTPETAGLLPTKPSVSVTKEGGDQIKAALQRGPVRVRLETEVYRNWNQLPLLVANLRPARDDDDSFVLFSGHVDSWYYGAMDNGTANATMIEVARVLAGHRDEMKRGLRLAFWSGHSHARYAGSAWYADNHWQELHDHCVAHINVDSVGGNGATILSQGNSMAELREFVSDAIEPVAGQRLDPRRYGRSGDQSFWGHGIPAALMSLSEQPPENADPVLLALHHQISGGASKAGGLGSWWHTPEDTVDKIDPAFLERDAQIYTLLLHRLCTTSILPLDYSAVLDELRQNLAGLAATSRGFELAPVHAQISALASALDRLRDAGSRAGEGGAAVINDALMAVGRALIPVDYTASGMFDHDLAVPTRPLPGLAAATRLAELDPDSDEYHFLHTRLVRERNRLVHGLVEATRAADAGIAALSS